MILDGGDVGAVTLAKSATAGFRQRIWRQQPVSQMRRKPRLGEPGFWGLRSSRGIAIDCLVIAGAGCV
jgi:hypothetical protein